LTAAFGFLRADSLEQASLSSLLPSTDLSSSGRTIRRWSPSLCFSTLTSTRSWPEAQNLTVASTASPTRLPFLSCMSRTTSYGLP